MPKKSLKEYMEERGVFGQQAELVVLELQAYLQEREHLSGIITLQAKPGSAPMASQEACEHVLDAVATKRVKEIGCKK